MSSSWSIGERDLSLTAFRSMLRGGSGSDLPSTEARQRNREAGRRGIARGPGSARVSGAGGAAPRALAGAARGGRAGRAGRGAAARLLQLRSAPHPSELASPLELRRRPPAAALPAPARRPTGSFTQIITRFQ